MAIVQTLWGKSAALVVGMLVTDLSLLFAAPPVMAQPAQVCTWLKQAGQPNTGNWQDAARWNCVPGPGGVPSAPTVRAIVDGQNNELTSVTISSLQPSPARYDVTLHSLQVTSNINPEVKDNVLLTGNASLSIGNDVQNNGQIVVSTSSDNPANKFSFLAGVGHSILGSGQFRVGTGIFESNGNLTNQNDFRVETRDQQGFVVRGSLENQGRFDLTRSGNQISTANIVNGDFVQTANAGPGTADPISIIDGKLTANNFSLERGTVFGAGEINANVTNGAAALGKLKPGPVGDGTPGSSVGTLTINGSYTQGPRGLLEIDIGKAQSGLFVNDLLVVNGMADLKNAGVLSIDFFDIFQFAVGREFDFIESTMDIVFPGFSKVDFNNATCQDLQGATKDCGTLFKVEERRKGDIWELALVAQDAGKVVTVPEPSTPLLLGIAVIAGLAVRRSRTL